MEEERELSISEQMANAIGVPSLRQVASQLGCRVDSREAVLAHKRFLEGRGSRFAGDGKAAPSMESTPVGRARGDSVRRQRNANKEAYQVAESYWRSVNISSQAKKTNEPGSHHSSESSPYAHTRYVKRKSVGRVAKIRLPDGSWYVPRCEGFLLKDLQSFLGATYPVLKKYANSMGFYVNENYVISDFHAKLLIGFHRSMMVR